jgi:hypothetical protein
MYANNNLKFHSGNSFPARIMRYILLKYLGREDIINADIAMRVLKKKHLDWLLTDTQTLICRLDIGALEFLEKWNLLELSAENRIGSGIVALVRRLDVAWAEDFLKMAIKYENFDVADYFFPFVEKIALHSVLATAVTKKDWRCMEWLFHKGYKFSGETVTYAICHGKTGVLKMFFTDFTAENIHLYLAAQTSAKSVRWLCKNIYFSAETMHRAFLIACKAGHFEAVKWFLGFTDTEITRMALELARPHTAIFVMLVKKFKNKKFEFKIKD